MIRSTFSFAILILAVIIYVSLGTELLFLPEALAYTPYTVKLNSSPWDIIVNQATNTIYVSHVDTISVIDGSSYSTVATLQLGDNDYIEHMTVNPLTNTLYATARDSNMVYVIDMETNEVVDAIPARGEPQGVAVNPSTNLVYVANAASGKSESYDAPVLDNLVSVIDGMTNQIVADIDVGGRFMSEEGITQ
jgi:YVTN family beta-propeller protein